MENKLSIGKDVKIDNKSKVGEYVEIGDRCNIKETSIGDYTLLRGNNQLSYAEIGKFVAIAHGARINAVNHPAFTRIAQHSFTYQGTKYGFSNIDDESVIEMRRNNKVIIGNDVWIGHGAIIMPGVHIGNGAVIGSGAVVTHDVEPYQIVVGVPAKPINKRFDTDTIEKIEKSKWWDWSHEEIKARYNDFRNIDEFIKKWC